MPIDSKYVIERQGKPHVLYAGLLHAAHGQGLKRITTKLLQVPGPENGHVAICFAEVELEDGFFTGIGDVDAGTEKNPVARGAPIRMAETRAKARALRDALDVGELLADDPSTDDDRDASSREPGVSTRGAAAVNADSHRPANGRPAPPAPEWPQDEAPHPADTFERGPIDARPDLAAMSRMGATPKQIQTIEGLLKRAHRPPPDDLTTMTRAAASELISDLIGAVGVGPR